MDNSHLNACVFDAAGRHAHASPIVVWNFDDGCIATGAKSDFTLAQFAAALEYEFGDTVERVERDAAFDGWRAVIDLRADCDLAALAAWSSSRGAVIAQEIMAGLDAPAPAHQL